MRRWGFALAAALCSLTAARADGAPRVVTLGPHLAEIVCAVGACDTLVGVIAYTDYPPATRAVPVIGDAVRINQEALIGLHPTHVLAWDGGTPPATIARLRELHLPVTVVTTRRLDDVGTALERIGAALGHAGEGRFAAAHYRQRIENLARQHRGVKPVRVFYQIETAPAYTVNRDSPISEVIRLCGGDNIFAGLPTLSAPVSEEAVLALKPEVVLHSDTAQDRIHQYWSRFAAIPPARRIVYIDGNLLTRAGPRLADGAEQVCAALDAARAAQSP